MLALQVVYDLNQSSRSLSSYRVSIWETDEPETGRLARNGPVYNNKCTDRGVFRDIAAIGAALAEYLPAPFALIESTVGADVGYVIGEIGSKSRLFDDGETKVVYRHSSKGTYSAPESTRDL